MTYNLILKQIETWVRKNVRETESHPLNNVITKTITMSHSVFFELFILQKYKHLVFRPMIHIVFV